MKLVIAKEVNADIDQPKYVGRSKKGKTVKYRKGERLFLRNKDGDELECHLRRILNGRLLILDTKNMSKARYSTLDMIQLLFQAYKGTL